METPENAELKRTVQADGQTFTLFLERERGVSLYANADRSRYLRMGNAEQVKKELGFHKQLLAEGFPVAAILLEGQDGGDGYWVEESLGAEHLTNQFYADIVERGEVTDAKFDVLVEHAAAMRDAQARTCVVKPYDFFDLARAVGETGMEDELPAIRFEIQTAWEKAKEDVRHLPVCLTHGDFNPTNVMDRGVIDFGDHFEGPIGFDMVNAITTPMWFPKGAGHEYFRKYDFTDAQIDRFFARCGTFETPHGTVELREHFDALLFLKANWWAVRNHKMPKMQTWRYEVYKDLVHRYIEGESLYNHWRRTNGT